MSRLKPQKEYEKTGAFRFSDGFPEAKILIWAKWKCSLKKNLQFRKLLF